MRRHGVPRRLDTVQKAERLVLCNLLGRRSGLLCSNFCTDLRGDIPDLLESKPGTNDKDTGNQDAQNLDTGNNTSCLCHACISQSSVIANPAQRQNGGGVTEGLADTAGQV